MKKAIGLMFVIIVICVMFLCGCSGAGEVQKAIDSKDYQTAREEIEKMKEGAEKDKITVEYEDALFADTAQFLNSKDYVTAHKTAEQSVSGKCMDAVMYVTLLDFTRNHCLEDDVLAEIMQSLANTFAQIRKTGDKSLLNTASAEGLKKLTPLFNVQTAIPENILPEEARPLYEYYLDALLNVQNVCEELPDAFAEDGQIRFEFAALVSLCENYNPEGIKLRLAQALMYFDDGHYVLPDEYQQLLNNQYDFNNLDSEQNIQMDISPISTPTVDADNAI